jgi:hypothetical protein
VPHLIKIITEIGHETAEWIFDKYAEIRDGPGPIDLSYFKDLTNKEQFVKQVQGKGEIIDYHLFGIHTLKSKSLVNFISSTQSPKVSLHNFQNDLIILFWIIKASAHLYVSREKVKEKESKIIKLGLPVLKDSFSPDEMEISVKGFIPPHYILGVFDLNDKS